MLLVAFSAAIAAQLAAGRAPDCHSFGRLPSAPVGPVTVLRNAALAILALLVVAATPAPGRARSWSVHPGLILFALCMVAGSFIVQRVRHRGRSG